MPRRGDPSSKPVSQPKKSRDSVADNEAILENMRSLLDEMNSDTKFDCVEKFLALSINHISHKKLAQVVEIIYEKAVGDPMLSHLYAELCKWEVECVGFPFRAALLKYVVRRFHSYVDLLRRRSEKVARMESESNSEVKNLLKCTIENTDQRCFGVISFVAHLCCRQLFPTRVIVECLHGFQTCAVGRVEPEPPYDECVIKLIGVIEDSLEAATDLKWSECLNEILENLRSISPEYSQKLSSMISNVMQLRLSSGVEKVAKVKKSKRKSKRTNTDQDENDVPAPVIPQYSVGQTGEEVSTSGHNSAKKTKKRTSRISLDVEEEDVLVLEAEGGELGRKRKLGKEKDDVVVKKARGSATTEKVVTRKKKELLKDNERLEAMYEEALATVRSKDEQLDSVTRELSLLKEEHRAVQRSIQEKSVVEKKKQSLNAHTDWHSSDHRRLTTEWQRFHSEFNTLHKNIKDHLQQSFSAKDASVLSTKLDNVRSFTQVAESVRDKLLKHVGRSTKKIQGVLGSVVSVAPTSIKTEADEMQ